MVKKQFEYGIMGILIGIAAGALLGFSILSQMNKTERSMMLIFIIGTCCIIGALAGYVKGASIGKAAYIQDVLGINSASDNMLQDGRYWVGVTKWTDKREHKENTLLTARSHSGFLVTELNEEMFINHEIKSASRANVEKHHRLAKKIAYDRLMEEFLLTERHVHGRENE